MEEGGREWDSGNEREGRSSKERHQATRAVRSAMHYYYYHHYHPGSLLRRRSRIKKPRCISLARDETGHSHINLAITSTQDPRTMQDPL